MKRIFLLACAVALLTACEKSIESDQTAKQDTQETTLPDGTVAKTKKFTFTLKGDFSGEWKKNGNGIAEQKTKQAARRTVGYLAADGKDMTDVWVLDYMNGQLVQQVHQGNNKAEDFGVPVMQLAYGAHHVYFIASRGTGPDLNVGEHRLTWEKVSDTFYKDYEVNVVATSNGNRAVTLERVVTKLRLTFTDAIPDNAATINITPATWYKGLDYVTGEPCAVAENQTTTINIPSTSIGQTGVQASMFSVSTATEWTTNVTISSKTSADAVLGTATLTAVPLKANRVSDYIGPLFSAGGSMSLSLNGEWMDSYEGTW
jgi:hypothetical protein